MNDSITFVQIQEKLSLIPICSNQGEHRSKTYEWLAMAVEMPSEPELMNWSFSPE